MKDMFFSGVVVPNKRNGTKFGYPTANIFIDDKSLDGLYLGHTSLVDSESKEIRNAFSDRLPSLIFIGAAQTVGETEYRLETHILDFPQIDLYDSQISVEIVEKLRNNEKFKDEDELMVQMKKDEVAARKWFNK